MNVSRRSPTVTTALNRALQARDNGCRFPGCTHHRFVDAHHIAHRAHDGETTLANLLQLCRAHHRLVHEGGYRIQTHPDGTTTFHRPDGTPVQNPVPAPVAPGDACLRANNTNHGVHPTADTPVPNWHGEHPDYAYIIANLFHAAEYRNQISAGTPTTTTTTTTP